MNVFFRVSVLSLWFSMSTAFAEPADSLSDRINKTGLEILAELLPDDAKGTCISPYSIHSAMAMVHAGAVGETRTQMESALGFFAGEEETAHRYLELRKALNHSISKPDMKSGFLSANRLFVSNDVQLQPDMVKLLESHFNAKPELLDFQQPELARAHINQWVESKTRQRIQDLIPAGQITPLTQLVLTNALYVQAPWLFPFKKTNTKLRPFHLSTGEAILVPTMLAQEKIRYAKGEDFTAIGIPFEITDFQLVILLPDRGKTLTPSAAHFQTTAAMPATQVRLFLPKFHHVSKSMPLRQILQKMGIQSAFDRFVADFSGLAANAKELELRLSNVSHKTFFVLNEDGIEAAAATSVEMMSFGGGPPPPEHTAEVRVDRPFYFAVQHVPTCSLLFLGMIKDPR